jgi:hypothetical protein
MFTLALGWVGLGGAHSTFGSSSSGSRRAIASTDSTFGSSRSAASRLVPTFPVASTTTTGSIT